MAQMDKQAYFLQVAADQGKLELCRFLLQKSSLFHRDDIINGARRRLLNFASHAPDKSSTTRLVEKFIHLLATEYGNDDGPENWAALGNFSRRHFDMDGPPLLPQNPVANAPFKERFAIAIESWGWHPNFFAASFHDDESAMLVTHANEAGKTALHWALGHYGYFTEFSRRDPGPDIDDVGITSGYANLAVGLIRKGSDVHSCWHDPTRLGMIYKSSPLISLLQFMRYWVTAELMEAVYQWGKILVEAGMSLQRYAAKENVFLRANRGGIHVTAGRQLVVAELGVLRVLRQDRLVAHVQFAFEVLLWKAMPIRVPGEWPASPSLPRPIKVLPEIPDTIIWIPEECDEREGFRWVVVGNLSITTLSYLVEPPGTTENHGKDSIDITPPPRLNNYRRSRYNDDFSVTTMEKDEEFRQRTETHAYTRRRSASAPAVESSERVGRHMFDFPGPWYGSVHKCATDMRWKLSSIRYPSLRDCLQGRCRDRTKEHPHRNYGWETWLMTHEEHIQVAKRFAERFCPQRLYTVEMTSARALERAQLAMAPARPPARSW
jgi:hypothetical protein